MPGGRTIAEAAMTSTCVCPSCQRPIQTPPGLAGGLVRCPKCAYIFWATDGRAPAREDPPPARKPGGPEPPPYDPRPPWERPGFVRRDCDPHRGEPLALLGSVSLLFGVMSLCLCLPALIAVPVGAAVWVTARRDLDKMRAGLMDPEGRPRT